MLNVDGNRYDREVFCGEDAWNCDSAGWRKNLRDNGVEGVLQSQIWMKKLMKAAMVLT